MSTDTPKIQYQKEVEVRAESFGRTRCMNPQRPKTKIKKEERREVQRDISHELPDWLQGFRENFVDESTSTEPWGNREQGSQDTSSQCELWAWRIPKRASPTTQKTGATRKKHFEIFRLEVFMNWVKWRDLRNCELTNSLYKKLTQSHDTIQQLTSQIQELQERVNCMNDSGEFQEKELTM